jgi:hypothetical protein
MRETKKEILEKLENLKRMPDTSDKIPDFVMESLKIPSFLKLFKEVRGEEKIKVGEAFEDYLENRINVHLNQLRRNLILAENILEKQTSINEACKELKIAKDEIEYIKMLDKFKQNVKKEIRKELEKLLKEKFKIREE